MRGPYRTASRPRDPVEPPRRLHPDSELISIFGLVWAACVLEVALTLYEGAAFGTAATIAAALVIGLPALVLAPISELLRRR